MARLKRSVTHPGTYTYNSGSKCGAYIKWIDDKGWGVFSLSGTLIHNTCFTSISECDQFELDHNI